MLTEDGKEPLAALADVEKQQHQAMFPGYIYCSAGRKGIASKREAGTSELSYMEVDDFSADG
jgi:hypothetical protein